MLNRKNDLSKIMEGGRDSKLGRLESLRLKQLRFYDTLHSVLVLSILRRLPGQFGSCVGTGKQTVSYVTAQTSCKTASSDLNITTISQNKP